VYRFDPVKPRKLNRGDTIGIFTPSSPAYHDCEGLFLNGIRNLEACGFKIKQGSVTEKRLSQGYRSAPPEERAMEFMDLILDPNVHALISTIGGSNSSSMIPYLDFEAIRASRKPICGYSDVTSLHVSILTAAGLRTFYGPSVMCWFGDWPNGITESTQWFLDAVMNHTSGPRHITQPKFWSNHARKWETGEWKTIAREWQPNPGWAVLNPGETNAPILAFNLNTLVCLAGTKYWPDFSGKILMLEDMDAPQSRSERLFQQLSLIGVFDQISGLIIGKPEFYKSQQAPFSYSELLMEVVGPRKYPIVADFDCGHTVPMLTIPQLAPVSLVARLNQPVEFSFLDGSVF
jgi:muramoyltetrapeptide carboxypeptidase LdcA involved in peptidoglycan recycling